MVYAGALRAPELKRSCGFESRPRHIDGIIEVKHDHAEFREKQEFSDSSCVLLFDFKKIYIEVDQLATDNDCGFGFNVYAGGEYKKKNALKLKNKDLENCYIDYTKYQVTTAKAFLSKDGVTGKMKKQYFIKHDIVISTKENEDYVYVEFITASGKFIYGWLKKSELNEIN